jgi:putative N-acetylmannosamine-6-phosphate epimerase
MPRGEYVNSDVFVSISLDEFESLLNYEDIFSEDEPPQKILVDIANGHMSKLHSLCKKFVELNSYNKHKLMVGNIANPKTFEELSKIGVDYVRVGIGGGSGCLTSANIGVHYPMGSLVNECFKIKEQNGYETKIVADGGFKNYDDIIKALALGADYVMLGGILNKALESRIQPEIDMEQWICKKLNITKIPAIELSMDTDEAQGNHHTGGHVPGSGKIWIYAKNRNLVDILRTTFHELVHVKQHDLDMIKPDSSYPGSPIEVEADAVAGTLIKIYGAANPHIFE